MAGPSNLYLSQPEAKFLNFLVLALAASRLDNVRKHEINCLYTKLIFAFHVPLIWNAASNLYRLYRSR